MKGKHTPRRLALYAYALSALLMMGYGGFTIVRVLASDEYGAASKVFLTTILTVLILIGSAMRAEAAKGLKNEEDE